MRRLNETEKELCRRLIKITETSGFIHQLFARDLDGGAMLIEVKNSKIMLSFPDTSFADLLDPDRIERYNIAVRNLHATINTLSLLEKEGLIYLYSAVTSVGDLRITNFRFTEDHPFFDINVKEVTERILTYTQKRFSLSPEFDDFVKNDFLTRTDKDRKTELRNSNIALWISALAVVVSAIAIVFDASNGPTSDDFKQLKAKVDSINAANIIRNKQPFILRSADK